MLDFFESGEETGVSGIDPGNAVRAVPGDGVDEAIGGEGSRTGNLSVILHHCHVEIMNPGKVPWLGVTPLVTCTTGATQGEYRHDDKTKKERGWGI